MTFDDFLQMRSMVVGHSRELDDPRELDVFIMNMKFKDYVQRVTRDERRQSSLLYKCQGDHLLETLNSVLMNSDSPARADFSCNEQRTPLRLRTPARDGFVQRSPRTPPRGTRVNQIGASSPNSAGTSGSNSGASGTNSGASDGTNPREYHDHDAGVPSAIYQHG